MQRRRSFQMGELVSSAFIAERRQARVAGSGEIVGCADLCGFFAAFLAVRRFFGIM